MHTTFRTTAVAIVAAVFTLVPGALAANATTTDTPGPVAAAPVLFSVLGDSLTAGRQSSLAKGISTGRSWVTVSQAAGEKLAAPAWAVSGTSTQTILKNALPTPNANVLVILAGTNDYRLGLTQHKSMYNIVSMANKVNAPVTIVTAIPPRATHPRVGLAFNAYLKSIASIHGYTFVDPWASVRTRGGWWTAGSSKDGIHPADDLLIGDFMTAQIAAAAQPVAP